MDNLIIRIRAAVALGMDRDAVVAHFTPEFTIEDVYLAYTGVLVLEGSS